ncbi:hypothetical protein GCM10009534_49470 [Kribbella sandramycini]
MAVLSVSLAITTSTIASAGFGEEDPPPSKPVTTGGTVTITVSGTALKGGSPGRAVSRKVSVPSPCWMEPSYTGKQYYEFVTGTGQYRERGGMAWVNQHMGENLTAEPGYEQYKDDITGRWWGGTCNSGNYDGPTKEFLEVSAAYFEEHPFTFIRAGRPVPVPPVPPEVLRDAAIAEMELPTPTIDWNPKTAESNGTIVNLDTWVWLTDRRDSLYVEATANTMGGPTSARVDVMLTGITVSADGAETAVCDGPGVPYSPSATGACAITLTRPGPTAVSTQSTWHATWSANGAPQGDIPTQPVVTPSLTTIQVSEIGTYNR